MVKSWLLPILLNKSLINWYVCNYNQLVWSGSVNVIEVLEILVLKKSSEDGLIY